MKKILLIATLCVGSACYTSVKAQSTPPATPPPSSSSATSPKTGLVATPSPVANNTPSSSGALKQGQFGYLPPPTGGATPPTVVTPPTMQKQPSTPSGPTPAPTGSSLLKPTGVTPTTAKPTGVQ